MLLSNMIKNEYGREIVQKNECYNDEPLSRNIFLYR